LPLVAYRRRSPDENCGAYKQAYQVLLRPLLGLFGNLIVGAAMGMLLTGKMVVQRTQNEASLGNSVDDAWDALVRAVGRYRHPC
jgi:hypothetical protein